METSIERTCSTASCALHISGAKLADALLNLGVPFATSYGPSLGPGYPEWQHARKMFHVPCNCAPDTDQPVEAGFSRCSKCRGCSIQGEIPPMLRAKPVSSAWTLCAQHAFTVFTACHNVHWARGSTKNTSLMKTKCSPCAPIASGNGRCS